MNSRLQLLLGEDVLSPLLSRQREAARLFAMGNKNVDVANSLGYHPQYMARLKRDIAPAIEVYNRARDRKVADIQQSVQKGAKDGLSFMLRVLERGTPEHDRSSDSLKVKVAQDLLDREGSAPKVGKQMVDKRSMHLHVTPDDLQKLRDAKEGKLREKYAKANTAESQLADIEVSNIS